MTLSSSASLQDQTPGSPSPGEPEFLAVGLLRRPHGVRGEIVMSVWTDFPERLQPGMEVFVGEELRVLKIRSVRWHREDLLISFEEYPNPEEAGLLRNQVLMVRGGEIPPLEDGEYYFHELIGLRVVDFDSGETVGIITDILETGANDVFVVQGVNGKEILIPDIDEVVLEIDIENQAVRIHLLPGLIDGND
jgi:16S rRNA processing protein RimM